MRPAGVRYPNGRLVHYTYGPPGGTPDKLSRLAAVNKDDGSGGPGNPLAVYSYTGAGRLASEDFVEPNVRLDYTGAGGDYAGFDRHGWVRQQLWRNYGTSQDLDSFAYAYGRNPDRLYRDNAINPTYAELYQANNAAANQEYDGLDRLKDFRRGLLASDRRSVTGTAKRTQT